MTQQRRRRRYVPLLAVVLWLGVLDPATVLGAMPQLVETMLDNAPAAAESRCSYTRIKQEGEESKRERYHAGQPVPWELLAVDGRPPTQWELRDYTRGATDRDRHHPLAFDLRSMVDPDEWRQLSEDAGEVAFEFRLRPSEELDARLVDKVRGTLVVDRERAQPRRIVIESTEPAYVAPFVRVADYRQVMSFEWNPAIGADVLTRSETQLNGRALGLKRLRQHKVVRYTEYLCSPAAL